jgi:uncharacterized membrane protein YkvI
MFHDMGDWGWGMGFGWIFMILFWALWTSPDSVDGYDLPLFACSKSTGKSMNKRNTI